ncbi:MAG: riboflavin synthase [Bryobacteraceae bacterium]
MFTGIVEELGTIRSIGMRPAGAKIVVQCAQVLSDAYQGCSIAVNGVCLTALDLQPDSFAADLAPETLLRTSLGYLKEGSQVNLERPLLVTGRLSGHVVQGHVDGTGDFISFELLGDENWWLKIGVPQELQRYIVKKGSIAIDGISLTIAAIDEDVLSVAIIPHTYHSTAMRTHRPGDKVNLECDIFAKYLEKMITPAIPV